MEPTSANQRPSGRDDPDEIWKPGWSGEWIRPADLHVVAAQHNRAHPVPNARGSSFQSRPRWWWAIAPCTALFLSVALIQRDSTAPVASLGEPLIVVPRSAQRLWSVAGPEFLAAADFDDHHDFVIAILNDGQPDAPAFVASIDAASGTETWRTLISSQPSQVDIAAIFSDTVVLSVRRAIGEEDLVGLDATTGQTLWQRRSATGATFVSIAGAGVLAERDALDNPGTTQLIDVRAGDMVGRFVGRVEHVHADGVIEYVNANGEFIIADLADRDAAHTVILDGVGPSDRAASFGDGVAVARSDGVFEVFDRTTGRRTARLAFSELADPQAVVNTAKNGLLIDSGNRLTGLSVSATSAEVDWSRAITFESIGGPGGNSVILATAFPTTSDAGYLVVDALTGLDLNDKAIPRPGGEAVIAFDGVVTSESNHLGGDMAGFGFSGEPLWTVSDPAVVRFGNGRVLALVNTPGGGHVLTVYGDPPQIIDAGAHGTATT